MRKAQAGGPGGRPSELPVPPKKVSVEGLEGWPTEAGGSGWGAPPCRLLRGQLPGLLSGEALSGFISIHLHDHSSSGAFPATPEAPPCPGERDQAWVPPSQILPHCPSPEGRTMG